MSEIDYKISFPKCEVNFMDNELTLSIDNIKSRVLSTLYFKLKLFDTTETLIYTYTSDRWVIPTKYVRKTKTFTINENKLSDAVYYQLEFYAIDVTSENPLRFNRVMLSVGEDKTYHKPYDIVENISVEFNKSSYANLYGLDDSYLQIIRPKHDKFTTTTLTGSACTVLVPHLENENKFDDPIDVFLEFINQTEQRIDVLR